MYKLQEKVFKMKTSTTTHLQLDKLDRVALEHLREALPYYTRLTDIAVNGTPLTNQDAIVQVVRAHIFCRDGWCFQFPFLGLQVAHLLHLFLIAVSSSGCNFPYLGKQWILCSVARGVVFLKPATKHLSKKTVVVVFCCCDCCGGGGGGAGCVEPHRGTRMQLRCFKVELGIYKWKIVDCVMQQKSLQRRCWIRQHWHSRS